MTDLEHPAQTPIPSADPSPRTKKRAVVWAIGLVVLITAWTAFLYSTKRDPERFADKAFVRAAGEECAQAQARIGEQQIPGDEATGEQRAASVERVTSILGDLARSLRALPVDRVDAPAAGRWLDELDAFVAVGPRYAAAIRQGDEHRAEDIGNEGDPPNDRFNATARANGIGHCVLR